MWEKRFVGSEVVDHSPEILILGMSERGSSQKAGTQTEIACLFRKECVSVKSETKLTLDCWQRASSQALCEKANVGTSVYEYIIIERMTEKGYSASHFTSQRYCVA